MLVVNLICVLQLEDPMQSKMMADMMNPPVPEVSTTTATTTTKKA
jgi:hypothetical protein